MLSFFEVIRIKRVFVELKLSQSIKIYNFFYSNLLWKALIDSRINQVNKPSTLVIINNKEEWEIEDIFNTRSYQINISIKLNRLTEM